VDFQYFVMVYCSGGMNIETKKHQSTLVEKTAEDINISSENLGEVSPYILDILLGKMCGMEMVFVSLTHMGTLWRMFFHLFRKKEPRM